MKIFAKRRVFPFEELTHAGKGFAVRQVYPKIAIRKEQESEEKMKAIVRDAFPECEIEIHQHFGEIWEKGEDLSFCVAMECANLLRQKPQGVKEAWLFVGRKRTLVDVYFERDDGTTYDYNPEKRNFTHMDGRKTEWLLPLVEIIDSIKRLYLLVWGSWKMLYRDDVEMNALMRGKYFFYNGEPVGDEYIIEFKEN